MALFGPPDIKKLKATGNVRGLVRALGYKKDRGVIITAAQALGYIGDVRAVEPIIATLGDAVVVVRFSAAWALGDIGDTRAVEPLIASLGDENEDVCTVAARALEELGWKPDRGEDGAR